MYNLVYRADIYQTPASEGYDTRSILFKARYRKFEFRMFFQFVSEW